MRKERELSIIFNESILFYQKKQGYRVSIDPFILASEIAKEKVYSILDIGCGVGIIPLILGRFPNIKSITGIEIQKDLYELAVENIKINKLTKKVKIIQGDIRKIKNYIEPLSFDFVVSNPPFYKKSAGRINPLNEKAIARHEIKMSMNTLLSAINYSMKNNGKAFVLYPVERFNELLLKLYKFSLSVTALKFIHPLKEKPAVSFITKIEKSKKTCLPKILPPLIIKNSDKNYSKDLKEFLDELKNKK